MLTFGVQGDSVYWALLHCTNIMVLFFFFNKWKVCGNPESSKFYQHHVSNSIGSLHVSVSHFGNSCSISNFFIIIICYGDCDQ